MRATWLFGVLLFGCGEDTASTEACEEGAASCDGDVLVECVDGVEAETDCAAEGLTCHAEMGHCM